MKNKIRQFGTKLAMLLMASLLCIAFFGCISSSPTTPYFRLNHEELALVIGSPAGNLTLEMSNDISRDLGDTPILWEVVDPTVVTLVTPTGNPNYRRLVHPMNVGETRVRVTVGDRVASAKVVVSAGGNVGASLEVTSDRDISLFVGGTSTILFSEYPIGSTTFSSNNASVAIVNNYGLITAVGGGDAVITARAGNVSISISVTVTTTRITLPFSEIQMLFDSASERGEVMSLDYGRYPLAGSIAWTSDDTDVVTVQNGVLTAVGYGDATIHAVLGTAVAQMTVRVRPKIVRVTLDNSNITIAPGTTQGVAVVARRYEANNLDANDSLIGGTAIAPTALAWTSSNTNAVRITGTTLSTLNPGSS
ncbi:MAG: Ig-like domain-containing protein, partial [Firmicutes bacterium]|nr:Ig-like domain-containing protein [Bacillota bacterium]